MFESRSSVLFCLWEMSGIIPTLFQLQLGSQICCPFFGTLVWHKSRGPATAAVKFGVQLQPAILWQVLCDQQWPQRNTFQIRTPRQRCEKKLTMMHRYFAFHWSFAKWIWIWHTQSQESKALAHDMQYHSCSDQVLPVIIYTRLKPCAC